MALIKYEDIQKVLWDESCLMSDEISEMLDLVPLVDAALVVRCKDCEYSYESIGDLCCSHGVCVDCIVPPDFYCAEGKRKEDESK